MTFGGEYKNLLTRHILYFTEAQNLVSLLLELLTRNTSGIYVSGAFACEYKTLFKESKPISKLGLRQAYNKRTYFIILKFTIFSQNFTHKFPCCTEALNI